MGKPRVFETVRPVARKQCVCPRLYGYTGPTRRTRERTLSIARGIHYSAWQEESTAIPLMGHGRHTLGRNLLWSFVSGSQACTLVKTFISKQIPPYRRGEAWTACAASDTRRTDTLSSSLRHSSRGHAEQQTVPRRGRCLEN